MKGQLPNPVQEVYSSDGWTQWNPLISTENRPAHISSAARFSHVKGLSSTKLSLRSLEMNELIMSEGLEN